MVSSVQPSQITSTSNCSGGMVCFSRLSRTICKDAQRLCDGITRLTSGKAGASLVAERARWLVSKCDLSVSIHSSPVLPLYSSERVAQGSSSSSKSNGLAAGACVAERLLALGRDVCDCATPESGRDVCFAPVVPLLCPHLGPACLPAFRR